MFIRYLFLISTLFALGHIVAQEPQAPEITTPIEVIDKDNWQQLEVQDLLQILKQLKLQEDSPEKFQKMQALISLIKKRIAEKKSI